VCPTLDSDAAAAPWAGCTRAYGLPSPVVLAERAHGAALDPQSSRPGLSSCGVPSTERTIGARGCLVAAPLLRSLRPFCKRRNAQRTDQCQDRRRTRTPGLRPHRSAPGGGGRNRHHLRPREVGCQSWRSRSPRACSMALTPTPSGTQRDDHKDCRCGSLPAPPARRPGVAGTRSCCGPPAR
jgi:hypothetical protein